MTTPDTWTRCPWTAVGVVGPGSRAAPDPVIPTEAQRSGGISK